MLDSVQTWKKKVRAGEKVDAPRLFKELPAAVLRAAGDEAGDKPVTFIMSTAAIDRGSDTIAVEGWKLDNYRKNPVWLFGHNSYDLPVGKSLREYIENGQLRSEVEFATREMHEFGWKVGQLVRSGFLNACSVGFKPISYVFNEERGGDSWFPPCDFKEQELLECSVVPVPANPEALVAGKSAGVDMEPLVAWAEQVLSRRHGKGLWLPQDTLADTLRSHAEATWKALRPPMVQVPATKAGPDLGDCLSCGVTLKRETYDWRRKEFTCSCGIRYADELAERAEIERVRDDVKNGRATIERQGDALVVRMNYAKKDDAPEGEAPMCCPECEGAIDKADKFCRSCGAELARAEPAEEPKAAPAFSTEQLTEALKSVVAESLTK